MSKNKRIFDSRQNRNMRRNQKESRIHIKPHSLGNYSVKQVLEICLQNKTKLVLIMYQDAEKAVLDTYREDLEEVKREHQSRLAETKASPENRQFNHLENMALNKFETHLDVATRTNQLGTENIPHNQIAETIRGTFRRPDLLEMIGSL